MPIETPGGRPGTGYLDSQGGLPGKLLSPQRRRLGAEHVQREFQVSERRACPVLGQGRSTQRYQRRVQDDEALIPSRIVALSA